MDTHADVIAVLILTVTIGLALSRPKIGPLRIEPAIASIFGASLTLLTGLVSLSRGGEILLFMVRPMSIIVSLMVVTLVAESAGLFENLGWRLGRLAKGSGRRLLILLFTLAATVGTLFTNDAAILIFTPLSFMILASVRQPGFPRGAMLPYAFAALYAANIVGPLRISNPIAVVVCSVFDIGFMQYGRWMFLPGVVSAALTLLGLLIAFRKEIPKEVGLVHTIPIAPIDPRLSRGMALIGLVALLGFTLDSALGLPNVYVAIGAGVASLLLHTQVGGGALKPIFKGVGWDAIAFATGIFFVANGLRSAGVTDHYMALLQSYGDAGSFSSLLGTALTTASFSALVNNHPVADASAMTLLDMGLEETARQTMVFAALIGGDLGPKMLPIGSLAALLWLRMIKDRGLDVPLALYVKVGVPVTLLGVLGAVLTLWVEILIFQ